MKTLTTVFAFIMLIAVVAFASVTYVFFQENTNWKKSFEDLKASTDKKITELNTTIAGLKEDVKKADAAREDYKKKADDALTLIGSKDTEIQGLNSKIKLLDETAKRQEDLLAKIQEDLKVQTTRNDDLSKKADDARVAMEKALDDKRIAEDRQRVLEDDVKNLQNTLKLTKGELKSSVDLNDRYKAVYGEDGLRLAQAAPAPVPYITGQITSADNPMRLVQISVGRMDGVTTGMTFEVVRPAVKEYVGRVRVLEVKDEAAVCRIDTAMTTTPMMEGDHVTTRVK